MTYSDKGLALYALMNDMSDALIHESDIRAGASLPQKTTRRGRFSAFMNHPAMVAVLCAVVSLGVLVAVVMAGRQGPVTPPVGGTLYGEEISLTEESEASTLRQNISLEDFYASDVYVSYSPGYSLLHCELIPERYVFQSANIGEEMPEEARVGFEGSEEQIAGLPKVEDPFELLRFHVSETRRNLFVFIHDADMNVIHRASLDVAEPVRTDKLAAGVYYVSLHSEWENDETYGADEFVFALSLSKEIDSLKIDMVWKEETKDTLPSGSQESETQPDDPSETIPFVPDPSIKADVYIRENDVHDADARVFVPTEYRHYDAEWDDYEYIVGEPGELFSGKPEQIAELSSSGSDCFYVMMRGICSVGKIEIYDTDMNRLVSVSGKNSFTVSKHLDAGTYYVVLSVSWERNNLFGVSQYVFALMLDEAVDSLEVYAASEKRKTVDVPFSTGMTYEEVLAYLEAENMSYVYALRRFVVSQAGDTFLILCFDLDGPFVIDDIKICDKKVLYDSDFGNIQIGMLVDEVFQCLGAPGETVTSEDEIYTVYKTRDDNEFRIDWKQKDGDFIVSRVVQIPDKNDVFWVGMEREEVFEVIRQQQMEAVSCKSSLQPVLPPYIIVKESDKWVYLLEVDVSVKRVDRYRRETPTEADISAMLSNKDLTLREMIRDMGAPLDYRVTGGEYSGVNGSFTDYYFRYITEEGGEYEIVFHHGRPQIEGGGSGQGGSFSFVKIIVLD